MSPAHPLIALVENDLPTNRAFSRLLKAHGFRVDAYTSAELLLSRQGQAPIDCLLLDVDLDGMSGIELQQRLRADQVHTPIIFITGRDDLSVRAAAFELGCACFLCKPVEAHVLVDAIHAAIAGSAGAIH